MWDGAATAEMLEDVTVPKYPTDDIGAVEGPAALEVGTLVGAERRDEPGLVEMLKMVGGQSVISGGKRGV